MKKTIVFLLVMFCTSIGFSQTFFEGFENTNGPQPVPSTAWSLSSGVWSVFDNNVGGTVRWVKSNQLNLVHSGNNCAYANRQNIGTAILSEEYLATPLVNIPSNGKLRFYSRSFTAGNQGTLYQIKIASGISSPTDPSSYVLHQEYTESNLSTLFNVYEEKIVDLTAYAGQNVYIAFVRKYTQPGPALTGDRWLLDDVSIESASSCENPANLNVSYTNSAYNLNWESTPNATSWEVLAIPCNQTVPASGVNGIPTSTNSYSITGLDPDGCYNFCVRSICNDATISNWSIINLYIPPPIPRNVHVQPFVDVNTNGVVDGNDMIFGHGTYSYELNNNGITQYYPNGISRTFTSYDPGIADYGYQISPEYSPYYTLSTSNYDDYPFPQPGTTETLYFPITITQPYNDFSVHQFIISCPIAGQSYKNHIIYRNNGIGTSSGTITFTKNSNINIFSVSEAVSPTSNGFTYAFSNLAPNETRHLIVIMTVNYPNNLTIGEILTNQFVISGTDIDINPSNNTLTIARPYASPYDPNNKTESHGGQIQIDEFSENDYLNYTINFQNIGNAPAINVRIEDLFDSKIDETSIQMIAASHEEYDLERVGNNLVWKFQDIQLQPASVSEEFSKGFVHFKVKPKPGYAIGDIIPNTASIYFDTNAPIITNTSYTEFVDALGNPTFGTNNIVLVPNPADDSFSIQLQNTAETIASISITDMVGKNIRSMKFHSENQADINVSELSKGIYLVEITTASNLKTIKKLVIR